MKRARGRDAEGVVYLCKGRAAHLGVFLAVVALSVACSDTAPEKAITAPLPAAIVVAPPSQTSPSQARPTDPVTAFHAKNFADWVGQAHNKALDDFFTEMLADMGAPKGFCIRALEFMSDPARLPPGKIAGTRDQRRASAVHGLGTTGLCSGELTSDVSSVTWPLGLFRLARFSATLDSVSAAANYLLDKIANAQTKATTATALATALTPILGEADRLVSEERELVYATASVTQSSYEYWVANIAPQSQQVDATYGPCLGQYSDQAYALSTCMGIHPAITPTRYDKPGMKERVIFASSTESGCDDYLNRGTIGYRDLTGAAAGGFMGFRTGGLSGILPGALFGGAYASAAESWGQFGKWAYCRRTGGGGPGTGIKLT